MTAPNEVVKRPNLRHGAAHHHRDAQTAKPQTFRTGRRPVPLQPRDQPSPDELRPITKHSTVPRLRGCGGCGSIELQTKLPEPRQGPIVPAQDHAIPGWNSPWAPKLPLPEGPGTLFMGNLAPFTEIWIRTHRTSPFRISPQVAPLLNSLCSPGPVTTLGPE